MIFRELSTNKFNNIMLVLQDNNCDNGYSNFIITIPNVQDASALCYLTGTCNETVSVASIDMPVVVVNVYIDSCNHTSTCSTTSTPLSSDDFFLRLILVISFTPVGSLVIISCCAVVLFCVSNKLESHKNNVISKRKQW